MARSLEVMKPEPAVPVVVWLLAVVLFIERLAAGLFREEFAARAVAGGSPELDPIWTLAIADCWAPLGFALGAALALVSPRIAVGAGVALSALGASYSMQGSTDWRVVAVLVAVGSACSTLGVYVALSRVLQVASCVSQRLAPVALCVFAERLASVLMPLLTPEIWGGFATFAAVLAWGVGLGLVLASGVVSGSIRTETRRVVGAREARGWFGAGALVIFGAFWLSNSLVVPGEFEASRGVVYGWSSCVALSVIALVPFVRLRLSARRALLVGLVASAGAVYCAVVSHELHLRFTTWIWVVAAGCAGALLQVFAFAVFSSGGKRVASAVLFAYFFITHAASSSYYLYQGQELPGGLLGVLAALISVPLLVILARREKRFSRLLMLDA